MKIEVVKLADINPYYNNPRDNSKAVQPVVESIKRYGFVKPIICDRDSVIIAGHTRYVAAYQLGLEYVPVVFSDMDEEKAKLFRIADNKLAEKSEFDEDKLIEELKALEVPESMQAFFFEDVNELINFSFNDFAPVGNSFYNTEGDGGSDYEETNEGRGNAYSQTYSSEADESYEQEETESSEWDSEEPTESTQRSEYDDLYRVKLVDGQKIMKVVCPYCGNIETIVLE